jgi:hypothetical protein
VFGRFVGRAVSAAAALCLLASPAEAAVEADFNGDGVLDRVVLPRPPDTNIVVRVSGGVPQVLKFHDRIISIVATDVNHDGEIDLSALSERRGVFIWLNKGKAANGHLKTLKRKQHHRRGFSLNTGGPLASAPGSSSSSSNAAGASDDRGRSAHDDHPTYELNWRPVTNPPSPAVPALPDRRAGASSSRAPPCVL